MNELPIEMDEEHRDALDDPPEFSDEQMLYLEAVMALPCCHVTGMHDPKHWVEDGNVCKHMALGAWRNAMHQLDLEVPIVTSADCGKCGDWYDESPYDEEHPTYSLD